MKTVIIKLDSAKMSNPDLDIRCNLPERIEKLSNGTVRENDFDYISGTELGIWLGNGECRRGCGTDHRPDWS